MKKISPIFLIPTSANVQFCICSKCYDNANAYYVSIKGVVYHVINLWQIWWYSYNSYKAAFYWAVYVIWVDDMYCIDSQNVKHGAHIYWQCYKISLTMHFDIISQFNISICIFQSRYVSINSSSYLFWYASAVSLFWG